MRRPASTRSAGISHAAVRVCGLVACTALFLSGAAPAAELLVGTAPDGGGSKVVFVLEAESRADVVGGRIFLGELEYEISRVSRLGLIGARRFATDEEAGGGTLRGVRGVLFVVQ